MSEAVVSIRVNRIYPEQVADRFPHNVCIDPFRKNLGERSLCQVY